MIKTREMFGFLPLIDNSVNIGLSFLLLSISAIISSRQSIICVSYSPCILQYFYKHDAHNSGIQ